MKKIKNVFSSIMALILFCLLLLAFTQPINADFVSCSCGGGCAASGADYNMCFRMGDCGCGCQMAWSDGDFYAWGGDCP